MTLLYLVFFTILIIVFGILAVSMRSTPEQSLVQRRISTLIAPQKEFHNGRDEQYVLTRAEPKSFGWLDSLIERSWFARKIGVLILQSHRNTTPGSVLIYIVALSLTMFIVLYSATSMALVALVAGCIAAYIPIAVLGFQRYRRILAFNAVLPDCIETCARSLRAGHSIVAAINIVAELSLEPAKTEFGEVFKKQNYGLPLREALIQMLERVPSADLQVMVTGILVQKDTGGNLAEILDRTAAVIRDRLRIQGDIRTHTAQGRLTGWILFLLPVVMMLAINLINPGYSYVLFDDPLGRKLLYAGLGLLVVGGLIIRHVVNGIEV